MVSPTIGFWVLGIITIIVVYILFYPQLGIKKTSIVKAPRVRGKSLLFDKRYGLCSIESRQNLGGGAMKLELSSQSGGTYYAKYYEDEIMMYNISSCLAGTGSPIYITKKDYLMLNGEPTQKLDVIQQLKDENRTIRAKAKIQIHNPNAIIDKTLNWLTLLESSTKRSKVESK